MKARIGANGSIVHPGCAHSCRLAPPSPAWRSPRAWQAHRQPTQSEPTLPGGEGSRKRAERRLRADGFHDRRQDTDRGHGHSAVGHDHQSRGDGCAGRDLPAGCAAQRSRHHVRRCGRRRDRQQHQPARLHRAHGLVSGWDSRSWPVLPGRLLARCRRGAEGTLVDALRTRFDRRCDQPGEQGPVPHARAITRHSPPARPLESAPRRTSISRCPTPRHSASR